MTHLTLTSAFVSHDTANNVIFLASTSNNIYCKIFKLIYHVIRQVMSEFDGCIVARRLD